ncbi:hypothetical protein [Nocardia thailandica]|uniref:hypothetical protein n=1 Tax=Nocardia thailandica TaxID=257275 RepID=UPI0002E05C79|nr:hypothetical protein [Nocardia thailandica]
MPTFTLTAVEQIAGAMQVTLAAAIEVEGAGEPACVAEPLIRLFPPATGPA